MEISQHVDVIVSASSQQVTQKGFGVPLILGSHTHWNDLWRAYTSTAGMIADGFLVTDPEYLIASILEAQSPAVEKWIVGRRTNLPTMHWTLTPVVVNGATYSIEVDGEVVTYTADSGTSASEIVTGLRAAFDIAAPAGVTDGGTTTMTLVADVAGAWHQVKNLTPSLLTLAMDHANNAVATDLAAIYAQNNEWYVVMTPYPSALEAAAIAAWVETNKRFFMFTTQDTAVINGTTGNIGRTLKDAAYDRSFWVYSADNGNFIAEGLGGAVLPQKPGSETWKFQTIKGVTAQVLTDNQVANVNTNNGNWYVAVGGSNRSGEGVVSSGRFADEVRGIDWLGARTGERIFGTLVNTGGLKVPMTDEGIAVIEAALRAQVQEGIDVGLLTNDPAPTFSIPKASAISSQDRASRILKNVKATAYLAGAVHKVSQLTINVLA